MTLFALVHIFLCLFLIGLVLIQDFKGGAMGVFGGGGSQSIFGASGGGNFLITLTKWVSIVLLGTVLGLGFLTQENKSVFESGTATSTTQPLDQTTTPQSEKKAPSNPKK